MHNVFARFLLDERAETRDRAGRQTPTRVGCFAVILGMLIGTSIPGRQWFATMAVASNDLADGLDRLIEFSDFIVYADESGDHGLGAIDPQFPVFALIFCVIRKADYADCVVPAVQRFKFNMWGHDAVVLHEHDIRKSKGPYAILLTDREMRDRFYDELTRLVEGAPMTIFAAVIDKPSLRAKYAATRNPYRVALLSCMEQLRVMLGKENQRGRTVHVIFESRGRREDRELELEFRRIAANDVSSGQNRQDFGQFNFQPVFVAKAANSTGLQLADLTARPIALSLLRPNQPNRAFEIVRPKIGGLAQLP